MIDGMSPPEHDEARASVEWRALRDLAPHLWPKGNVGARLRVLLALALLSAAKVATVYVPILLKKLVDLLADPANLPVVVPLGLVVGYGVLRVATIAFACWAGCDDDGVGGDAPGAGPSAAEEIRIAPATMHRLNRTEYRNTVRDLLGSALDPAANFPADDVSLGFDNIADVLTTSPTLFELYELAATDLAAEALALPIAASTTHLEAEAMGSSVGVAVNNTSPIESRTAMPTTARWVAPRALRAVSR